MYGKNKEMLVRCVRDGVAAGGGLAKLRSWEPIDNAKLDKNYGWRGPGDPTNASLFVGINVWLRLRRTCVWM